MSKVTYLLGAGASFGKRREDGSIERGIPTINEFSEEVDRLIVRIKSEAYNQLGEYKKDEMDITEDEFNDVLNKLEQLRDICELYPTIDTFAKQVYITHSNLLNPHVHEGDYEYIKRVLTAFLIAVQSEKSRDPRYDGFIASIIKEGKVFPSMTILSWNYDAQFELAYSGYAYERYIPYMWNELNVFDKTYPTQFNMDKPFAMVKLNGTAFFKDAGHPVMISSRQFDSQFIDPFFGGLQWSIPKFLYNFMHYINYANTLSYAWENSNRDNVLDVVKKRVVDTKELIVIGYSFPYVNREIDFQILQSMPNLETIYVQDPNFTEIESRLISIVGNDERKDDHNVQIRRVDNLSQFYLPAGFE